MTSVFLSDSPIDHGAACLATVLGHYGLYVTPVDLAGEMVLTRAGASRSELIRVAERYGLEGRRVTVGPDRLTGLEMPFLARIAGDLEDRERDVVVLAIEGDRVRIGDPAHGAMTLDRARFAERYAGEALVFTPTDQLLEGKRSRTYGARFWSFLKPYRGRILVSVALGATMSLLVLGLVYLGKVFVDTVLPSADQTDLWVFVAAYFAARLLVVGIESANGLYVVSLRNRVADILSNAFFARMVRLEKRHLDSRAEGELIQLFTRIETLTEGIADYFGRFILVSIGIAIKGCLLVWLYDSLLVGLLLAITAAQIAVSFLFSRVTTRATNRQILVMEKLHTTILDSLSDIRVIRIFGARGWVAGAFTKLLNESLRLLHKLAVLRVAGRGLAELCQGLAEVTIFLICGARILAGDYTVGDFLLFFTFAGGLASESLQLPELVLGFPSQLRAFARIDGVLGLEEERRDGAEVAGPGLEIVCEAICFGYEPDRPVLRDVDLTIGAGQTVAIVGESGSGKTTLMNLLMGFYQPGTGRILVNGRDLRELDPEAYRSRISAVFQNTSLLSETLRHNVTLGRPLDGEHLDRLARTLGADFVTGLPMGWDTLVYPGALSGGQTQQVGIMRAMAKPFDLLITDEATSHLDSVSEDKITAGIDAIRGEGKTRVMIAHRLSTVRAADQIVVMREGRIVERGSHDALMAAGGEYADLVRRQVEVDMAPG